VRLVVHLFARHSAPLAAAHAKLSARADAFARVLVGPSDRAALHRDAKHALDFVLAIPASEPALRRSCLVPLVAGISRGPIANRLAGLVAGNDRALRAGFAALCRGLPAPAPDDAELVVDDLPSRDRAMQLRTTRFGHGMLPLIRCWIVA